MTARIDRTMLSRRSSRHLWLGALLAAFFTAVPLSASPMPPAPATERCPLILFEIYDPTDWLGILLDEKNGFNHVVKHLERGGPEYHDNGRYAGQKIFELINVSGRNINSKDHWKFWQFVLLATPVPHLVFREANSEESLADFDRYDVIVMTDGGSVAKRLENLLANTADTVSSFNNWTGCKIRRTEQEFEIKQTFIMLDSSNDRAADLRCLYSGLLIFYGASNYEIIGRSINITKEAEDLKVDLQALAIDALYKSRIQRGFTARMLEDYLKAYFCRCAPSYPEIARPTEAHLRRVCYEK